MIEVQARTPQHRNDRRAHHVVHPRDPDQAIERLGRRRVVAQAGEIGELDQVQRLEQVDAA